MPPPLDRRPLHTFDVFDTVVTRAVGEPRSIGYVLAERLRADTGVDVAAEVFVAAYQRAEHLAYLRHGERRTTAHGSGQLADLLGLDAGAAAQLEGAELALELELTRPVPGQIARVRAARAAGARIGFLSDTPLPRRTVEGLLRRCGAFEEDDLLWVSNELGAEKSTGRAYAAVARELGDVVTSWQHSGDNRRSDVTMARYAGIGATWAPAGSLNRYERRLEASAAATGGYASLLAGAARRSRLVLEADGTADARAQAVTGVLAPLLAALALAAADAAVRAGCDLLVVEGAGTQDLLAVAEPLLSAVHGGLRLTSDGRTSTGARRAVVSTDVLTGSAPAGAAVRLHLAVAAGASGDARGWAFDERAHTGVSGASAAAVRGCVAMLPSGHPGLHAFAAELVGSALLLPRPPDLRASVQDSLDAFWSNPSAAEARAWCACVAGLVALWPQARHATAARPVRAALRGQERASTIVRKARRAQELVASRRRVGRS